MYYYGINIPGMRDLHDMYTEAQMAEGIHIRQITNTYVKSVNVTLPLP